MLSVYLASHCPSFDRAHALIAFLRQTRPAIPVEVVNLDEENVKIPEDVFGTPTYKWKGQIISLGNPSKEELLRMVDGLHDEEASNPR
jgi:hypothetical protein